MRFGRQRSEAWRGTYRVDSGSVRKDPWGEEPLSGLGCQRGDSSELGVAGSSREPTRAERLPLWQSPSL